MMDGVGVTRYTYTAVSQILSEDGPWNDDMVTYGSQSLWDWEGEIGAGLNSC